MKPIKRETTESYIWIFCIIVVLSLTIKLTNDAREYDCNKCTVSLYNIPPYGEQFKIAEENITKLIEAYKDGKCLYIWDPSQGYIKNG